MKGNKSSALSNNPSSFGQGGDNFQSNNQPNYQY